MITFIKKGIIWILILLILVIGALLLVPCKAGSLRSIKNRHIYRFVLEFPLTRYPFVPSFDSKEAKKRGSFIYDYQILPVINPKDSIVGIDIQEAFLEHEQIYNLRKDSLINSEGSLVLVLVISDRGRKMANNWNKKHYYFEMSDRYWMSGRKFRTKSFSYSSRPPHVYCDSVVADTIVMDIKNMFRRIHRPHPDDITEIWVDHTNLGKIILIKNQQVKSDSAGTKWNASLYYPYERDSYYYSKPKLFKKDTNGVLGRPVPQETISSQYFVTEQLETKHNGDTLIHRYKTPPVIDYQLNLVKLDFADVYLEKGENYYLVFVYSDEGKKMADKWNQDHGYHKLSWEKDGSFSLPLSPDTPLDTLLADTLVVNIKNLFKENPRQPQPDHVRKIWDEYYQFGTITLVRE